MGLAPLAFELYENKSAEEAVAFSKKLDETVKNFSTMLEGAQRKAGKEPSSEDDVSIEVPGVGWKFPLKNALDALQATVAWYEKVGRMGFGVKAWF